MCYLVYWRAPTTLKSGTFVSKLPPTCDIAAEPVSPSAPGILVATIFLTFAKPVAIIPAAPIAPNIPPCANAFVAP